MNDVAGPELVIQGNEPIHRQIADQVRAQVLDGALLAGEPLPSVRALAVGLAVTPAIVEKAYAELESGGYLTMAEGSGPLATCPEAMVVLDAAHRARLHELCGEFLARTEAAGFAPAAVLGALRILTGGPHHDDASQS